MKPLIFALCVVFACGRLSAQTNVWQPSPGHTQMPIWPGAVPDAQPVPGPEYVTNVLSPGGVPVDCGMQRLAADDDGLFAKGNEYGRCGGRVSRRRLQCVWPSILKARRFVIG